MRLLTVSAALALRFTSVILPMTCLGIFKCKSVEKRGFAEAAMGNDQVAVKFKGVVFDIANFSKTNWQFCFL